MAIVQKYGKDFDDSHEDADGNQTYDELGIEFWCLRKGKEWIESQGRTLEFHYNNIRRIIWPELDEHRWHDLCTKEIVHHKITVLMGPGSCVDGATTLLNPITGQQTPIKELCELGIRPMVMTVNGPQLARVPFKKGTEELFEVTLESGKKFISTKGHRVLTESGFAVVSSLQIGQCLISYDQFQTRPISEPVRRLSLSDARRSSKIDQDSQSDYHTSWNSCDGQPQTASACGQYGFALQDDAQACSRSFERPDHYASQEYNRPYRSIFHLSSSDALRAWHQSASPIGFYFSEGKISHAADSSRPTLQFLKAKPRFAPSQLPSADSFRNLKQCEMPCGKYRVQADAVQSIISVGVRDFYDLQVPGDHHYFAQGTIHHNSGKTHEMAWIGLVNYWLRPEQTCVLVASTHLGGLKKRVWAEICMLWEQGVERFPKLAGHLLDSAIAITTDNVEDCDPGERKIRDMRKGVFGVACITGGKFVGLAKFVGIKQKYMILLADEASMMGETFLSAFANLNKNENFQAIVSGNPNDPLDPLGRAAEPKEGWTDDYMEPTKTKVWDTRFMNGRCVNLIGLDSPNFDFPADQPTRYKYLISHEKINDTLSFFPKDSMEYYSQCVGSMKIGTIARRVLSRAMAKEFHAQEQAIWRDENRTRVYFVDSSYGGDRCVAGWGEFGPDKDGKQILSLDTPKIIPILIGKGVEPEDQIARFVKLDCEQEMIPPENMGHDATGRGSLGTSLAREWSALTNPIDAGGRPTKRPVSTEITIIDPETGVKRPKRCDEHYDRLVSEFWFSVRYCVESAQLRGLSEEALEELCARKWDRIRGDKYAVEVKSGTPNKPGMKERTGKSPDLGDWVAGIVEMARRKGFIISKLGNSEKAKSNVDDWFRKEHDRITKFNKSRQLQSA